MNARIFRNRLDGAQNQFTVAPAMPGPYFFVRNVATGEYGEAAVKMNTSGNSDTPSRNIFFYHNTFAREGRGHMINLWYGDDVAGHNVPIQNINFSNNIFWSQDGGLLTHVSNRGETHPNFDYNLWKTTADTDPKFQWGTSDNTQNYSTFSEFQQGSGQEANGLYGDPQIGSSFRPQMGSPVIDQGTVLPGINDGYDGSAPDMGAFEYASSGGMMDAGDTGGGSDAGGDTGSGSDDTGTSTMDGGGMSDTSSSDDTSGSSDGGTSDGGTMADASSDGSDGDGSGSDGGCNCSSSGAPSPMAPVWMIVVGAAVVSLRRD